MSWACSECPKARSSDLHPYTVKLLDLVAMQRGGYPLAANDLTIEEWIDLGKVKESLQPRFNCPLMAKK